MLSRILFIHSAGPQTENDGSVSFVRKLQHRLKNKYLLHHPTMPEPENPRYDSWSSIVKEDLNSHPETKVIIGHSLGGSVAVKLLLESPPPLGLHHLYLVASPFWGVRGWKMDEFVVKAKALKNLWFLKKIVVFHSIQDPWVPYSHAEIYAKHLPGAVLHPIAGSDHVFNDGLPLLEQNLLRN